MLKFDEIVHEINQEGEYSKRINALKLLGHETSNIENTVRESADNIKDGRKSFVIYGEPQSGKTELMIALSAKLIDEGYKIIIVLLNDDLELLSQNLQRFRDSSIDYASPNSKVNLEEKTKINAEIEKLLRNNGIYIGITATPARLDLNNTFGNLVEHWINFKPHSRYVGKDIFFPINFKKEELKYNLITLPDEGDKPEYIQKAIINFIVNVSILNVRNKVQQKYSFLVHTSGQIIDHTKDRKDINNLFEALCDKDHKKHEYFWNKILTQISNKIDNPDEQKLIFRYAYMNITNKYVSVLNSDSNKTRGTEVNPTSPPALFSIFIGGNKVSRGITFGNLLGMFFTRDTKHKLQQDTYIQRARMFGDRLSYIEFFELWIPSNLYLDWHRCFVYHYLSLKSIETSGSAPVWIGDNRIRPVSTISIDKKTLVLDKGEMAFAKFKFPKDIELNVKCSDKVALLENLNKLLGEEAIPSYVIDFIKCYSKNQDVDININPIRTIVNTEDQDYIHNLFRKRGTFGGTDIKGLHNILILRNENGFGRILYYYSGKVEFFKKSK